MTTASGEELIHGCEAVGDLVTAIRPDQWLTQTPCAEWNIRDLVNHLVKANLTLAALLGGRTMPGETDYLGADPVGAYQSSVVKLRDAVSAPGVLLRSYPSPFGGNSSGAELLLIRLADLLTHGWDLSQATDTPAYLPDDLVTQALALMREKLPNRLRAGRFAEPQPTHRAATVLEQLAAFAGRRVRTEP